MPPSFALGGWRVALGAALFEVQLGARWYKSKDFNLLKMFLLRLSERRVIDNKIS